MSAARGPRVALLDAEEAPDWALGAIKATGADIVPLAEAEALLLWHHPPSPRVVSAALAAGPGIRWVQLPSAGVDRYAEIIAPDGRVWTCAKGVYAEPVAEHALALALAGLRELPSKARAGRWTGETDLTLFDAPVAVVGAGGVAHTFLDLLRPFRARATVVCRRPREIPGAERVVGMDRLGEALPDALVVLLACALTDETRGLIGERELELMNDRAWLVNIARGQLVDTGALVPALRERRLGGAALDCVDPEPLPPEHELWRLDNCLITPHVACGYALGLPLLAERFAENLARFAAGEPLVGVVDLEQGY